MPNYQNAFRPAILVTGAPRSGTTWLARELARSGGTALAGREPMNPRGSQYGLGGTLTGWTALHSPSPRQERLLRSAYQGRNLFVYSRYGHRQWAAPLPWTRMIMKDPFAMLSIPAIIATTGALPVLIYRHPGAVLTSYRRMGWTPDLAEVRNISPSLRPPPVDPGGAEAMAVFWSFLYERALADLADHPGALIVSHEELSVGGPQALQKLAGMCGLKRTRRVPETETAMTPIEERPARTDLHDFDRQPAEVAKGWRTRISASDLNAIDSIAGPTIRKLAAGKIEMS
ncbi:hypothetical protein IWX75_001752 [Arthrobacter sp. CAN_A6]|uniref:sulfotransferase n=1 Tax=Arthrobacter sp. CAN_A6 TaxID=2787721 RepID=UPI0018C953D5